MKSILGLNQEQLQTRAMQLVLSLTKFQLIAKGGLHADQQMEK